MAPYRGSQKHEYNRQSSENDGLLTALGKADPADITLLGLTLPIAELTAHSDAFKVLMDNRTDDTVSRTPVSSTDTGELRSTTDELYKKIITRVNTFAITTPTTELEAFSVRVNTLIKQGIIETTLEDVVGCGFAVLSVTHPVLLIAFRGFVVFILLVFSDIIVVRW